jgi:hypothetical protein
MNEVPPRLRAVVAAGPPLGAFGRAAAVGPPSAEHLPRKNGTSKQQGSVRGKDLVSFGALTRSSSRLNGAPFREEER